MKITKQFLISQKACSDQVKIFTREWPKGANVTPKNLARAGKLGLSIGWLAASAFNLSAAEREKFCVASDNPALWRGRVAAYAPNLSVEERERFCVASDNPALWRGRVAAYAPNLSVEERERFCVASDNPALWRGRVASCAQAFTTACAPHAKRRVRMRTGDVHHRSEWN